MALKRLREDIVLADSHDVTSLCLHFDLLFNGNGSSPRSLPNLGFVVLNSRFLLLPLIPFLNYTGDY